MSPKKSPVFYGWIVLAVGTMGTISSIPGQTMGVSVFTEHLLLALDVSRTTLSQAYMIGTFCSGIVMLAAGFIIDRMGVRPMILNASIGLGLSLYAMANIEKVTAATRVLIGDAAPFIVAFVCFFAIRFFGQGLLALTPRVMIGRWWDKRRGTVMGIAGILVSFSFGVAPLLLQALVDEFDWRGAYRVLAILVGVGMGGIGYLFYRERPEDSGLLPDGAIPISDRDSDESVDGLVKERQFHLLEAIRTYPFWIFSIGLGSQGLVVTAVTFNIVSIAEWSGLTAAQGLSLFLPMSVLSAVTNLVGGWSSDRVKMKYVLITMMTGQLVGTYGLLSMESLVGRVLVVGGYGIAGGLFGTLIGVTWPRFFGTLHLGSISGLNMSIMVFSSSLGPIIFGSLYDRTNSYAPGIYVCLAMCLVILVGSFFGNNPQEKQRVEI